LGSFSIAADGDGPPLLPSLADGAAEVDACGVGELVAVVLGLEETTA